MTNNKKQLNGKDWYMFITKPRFAIVISIFITLVGILAIMGLKLEKYPDMVVVKSISKSFGVPGLRLGLMASSDKELISFVKKDVSIWNLNSFAEFFMQIYTKHEGDYVKAAGKFQNERQRFYDELQNVPFLKVFDSQANYFLCEVTDKYTSHELAVLLLKEHDVLIKDCSTKKVFNGRNYIRIAIRNAADNDRLLAALKSI